MQYAGYQLPDWENFNERHFNEVELPIIEECIARFNEGNKVVLLDAPTGLGKTVTGECVRQGLQTSGLYLCSTLSLEDQFMRDYGRDYSEVRGRANYTPTDATEGPWSITPTCADCDYDKEADSCSFCSVRGQCPYIVARENAYLSEMTCTNYAFAFGAWSSDKLKERGLVICDEACLLEGEIMRHVAISISPRMRQFLNLKTPKKTVEESWPGWFDYALPLIESAGRNLKATLRDNDIQGKRRLSTLRNLYERMKDVRDDLEGWVFTGGDDGIEFKPVRVDGLGKETLWDNGQRFLLMSATILSPEEMVESLGYEGSWAPVFAPSVFPVENRPIYFFPAATMTKKMEAESWPKMVTAVDAVIERYPDERVLVHSHSYDLTRALVTNLRTDRPVFAYNNSEERQREIEGFEKTPGAVLIAPSLDRGYDGKDDLVRCVILCKTPIPYLGDKQVSARLHSPGGDLWLSCATARSLVQMVGRGVRHDEDHADTWILDAYFKTFFEKWKARGFEVEEGRAHRLFPKWFVEAVEWTSDEAFELRQEIKGRALAGVR